eukprot:scaffold87116_cov17-Tisochrysis_lutea.AAC.5
MVPYGIRWLMAGRRVMRSLLCGGPCCTGEQAQGEPLLHNKVPLMICNCNCRNICWQTAFTLCPEWWPSPKTWQHAVALISRFVHGCWGSSRAWNPCCQISLFVQGVREAQELGVHAVTQPKQRELDSTEIDA